MYYENSVCILSVCLQGFVVCLHTLRIHHDFLHTDLARVAHRIDPFSSGDNWTLLHVNKQQKRKQMNDSTEVI